MWRRRNATRARHLQVPPRVGTPGRSAIARVRDRSSARVRFFSSASFARVDVAAARYDTRARSRRERRRRRDPPARASALGSRLGAFGFFRKKIKEPPRSGCPAMAARMDPESVILEEEIDENYEPSEEGARGRSRRSTKTRGPRVASTARPSDGRPPSARRPLARRASLSPPPDRDTSPSPTLRRASQRSSTTRNGSAWTSTRRAT
eukprot:24615-Pelagococcus_subviridis.AAC.7